MQEALPPRQPSFLQSCAEKNYSRDFTGSSVDSSHHREGGREYGHQAPYPSPPMSGPSPPPSNRPSLPGPVSVSSSASAEDGGNSQQLENLRVPRTLISAPLNIPEARQQSARLQVSPEASTNFAPSKAPSPPNSTQLISFQPGENQPASRSGLQSSSHSSGTTKRTKAHTPSACINCKKAHLRCEAQRPCPRCVKFNKESTCEDVRHKKRGRPRLREEREGMQPPDSRYRHTRAALQQAIEAPVMSTMAGQKPGPTEEPEAKDRPQKRPSTRSSMPLSKPLHAPELGLVPHTEAIEEGPPVAYLTLDFIFVKASMSFREASGIGFENIFGWPLVEVLSPASRSRLLEIRRQLDLERFEQERTLPRNPYALEADVRRAIGTVPVADYAMVTQSFTTYQPEELTFRTRGGQYRACQVHAKLARISSYFVSLLLPTVAQSTLTPQIQPAIYGSSQVQRRSLAPSPIFTSNFPSHPNQPKARSSAPSSPFFLSAVSGMPSPAMQSRSSAPGLYEPSYIMQTGSYPSSSVSSPISTLPRPAPSLPSPGPLALRRDSTFSSGSQRPQSMGDLQLPPIREGLLPFPAPLPTSSYSSTSMTRRHSATADARRGDEGREKDDGGNGRRKRARIDVKEVMD